MDQEKKIYEVDEFEKCPNCNHDIYRGRLNCRWGMIFYYRLKHDLLLDRKGRPVVVEENVRIGNPVKSRFEQAAICRHCLFIFFKAINYEPLRRGFEERFNKSREELYSKAKEESKKPLAFEKCPLCGNKIDTGYLCDNPPSGCTPGLVFYMRLNKPLGRRKEEPIIVAEDFLGHFYEAYFCDNCFTAIGRIEKFMPFSGDYWDRFERPTKATVRKLQDRINRMSQLENLVVKKSGPKGENTVLEEDDNAPVGDINLDSTESDLESIVENLKIEDIDEADIKELELFSPEEEISIETDEEDLVKDDALDVDPKLPYEYFPSVKSYLEPAARYQFCPHCGVENNSENRSCRRCGGDLPAFK